MTAPAQGSLASLLGARRTRYNAQFADARRALPALDARRFGEHLTGVVGPLVELVAQRAPKQAGAAADALYELSLDLVGRGLLGADARYPAIVEGWTSLLARLP